MHRSRRLSLTTALVALVAMLAVAIGSTASAADSSGPLAEASALSKRQITKLVRKEIRRVKRGPAGAPGAPGAPGAQGPQGPQGPAGGAGGTITKIDYRAISGSAAQVVFRSAGLQIEANCLVGAVDIRARSLADNSGISGAGAGDNGAGVSALYGQDADFDNGDQFQINAFTPPEENGTITYLSPAGQVTTITYLLNFQFANNDCVFSGTATTA